MNVGRKAKKEVIRESGMERGEVSEERRKEGSEEGEKNNGEKKEEIKREDGKVNIARKEIRKGKRIRKGKGGMNK